MAVAVSGIDLNVTDAETHAALLDALHQNLVLCVRDQTLAPVPFRDAMARFGTPVLRKQLAATPGCAEVNIISSEDRDELGDGKKLVNGASWHTDDSFMREPCSLTMLYGVVVPSRGGDTQFTNMYAAYETLPAEMKARIDGLQVIHKYQSSRQTNRVSRRPASEMEAMPEATHPLVRTHPDTGRKALYLNANRMEQIVGLERAESDALLDELIAQANRAALPIPPCLAPGRRGDLGQPLHHAQGQRRLSRGRTPPDAPRDRGRDSAGLTMCLPRLWGRKSTDRQFRRIDPSRAVRPVSTTEDGGNARLCAAAPAPPPPRCTAGIPGD